MPRKSTISSVLELLEVANKKRRVYTQLANQWTSNPVIIPWIKRFGGDYTDVVIQLEGIVIEAGKKEMTPTYLAATKLRRDGWGMLGVCLEDMVACGCPTHPISLDRHSMPVFEGQKFGSWEAVIDRIMCAGMMTDPDPRFMLRILAFLCQITEERG